MPYSIRKLPNKDLYRVYNSDTKAVHSYATTLENAEKQVKLLHMVDAGVPLKKQGGSVETDNFNDKEIVSIPEFKSVKMTLPTYMYKRLPDIDGKPPLYKYKLVIPITSSRNISSRKAEKSIVINQKPVAKAIVSIDKNKEKPTLDDFSPEDQDKLTEYYDKVEENENKSPDEIQNDSYKIIPRGKPLPCPKVNSKSIAVPISKLPKEKVVKEKGVRGRPKKPKKEIVINQDDDEDLWSQLVQSGVSSREEEKRKKKEEAKRREEELQKEKDAAMAFLQGRKPPVIQVAPVIRKPYDENYDPDVELEKVLKSGKGLENIVSTDNIKMPKMYKKGGSNPNDERNVRQRINPPEPEIDIGNQLSDRDRQLLATPSNVIINAYNAAVGRWNDSMRDLATIDNEVEIWESTYADLWDLIDEGYRPTHNNTIQVVNMYRNWLNNLRAVNHPNKPFLSIDNLKQDKSGAGIKKPANKWVAYVKSYASKHNMSYRDALRDPKCKAGYKKGGAAPNANMNFNDDSDAENGFTSMDESSGVSNESNETDDELDQLLDTPANHIQEDYTDAVYRWNNSNQTQEDIDNENRIFDRDWGELLHYANMMRLEDDDTEPILRDYYHWVANLQPRPTEGGKIKKGKGKIKKGRGVVDELGNQELIAEVYNMSQLGANAGKKFISL